MEIYFERGIYDNLMNVNLVNTTMKVLTIVLSFCGGNPSISINEQRGVLQRVQDKMKFCTNNRINIIPKIWPAYVDICPTTDPTNCNADFIVSQVSSQIAAVDKEQFVSYILPKEMQCDFAGLGSVGPCTGDVQCNTWINGLYANSTDLYLHELGHNLGLGHASYKGNAYGDMTDVMGECCAERCFNAVHLDTLHVQRSKKIIAYPIDDFTVHNVILGKNEYVTMVGGKKKYYLQNRQSDGYDQIPEFGSGLNVYIKHSNKPETSELIMIIGNSTKTFNIDNGISVTLLGITNDAYTISIHW